MTKIMAIKQNAIIAKMQAGVPDREIAEVVGCSASYISRLRNKFGYENTWNRRVKRTAHQLRELHRYGLTDKEISLTLEHSVSHVAFLRRSFGLKPNPSFVPFHGFPKPHVSDRIKRSAEVAKVELSRAQKRQVQFLRTAFAHRDCPIDEAALGHVMAAEARGML